MPNPSRDAYHRWLARERDARYWQCLANRMETYDGRLSIAAGILSSAAFLTFLTALVADLGLPLWAKGGVPGSFAVVSAGLSFWNRHRAYGKQSVKYAMLHGMCLQQSESWKSVSDALLEDDEVSPSVIDMLRLRDAALQAHEAGHKEDEALARECEEKVREMERRFKAVFLEGAN